jgi:hypothetical protein
MERIELAETIDALRDELAKSAARGDESDITFTIEGIELEFQVGVTKEGEGKAGIKFWVADLGVGGSYAHEAMQTVRITLAEPLRNGQRFQVHDDADVEPE